MGHGLVWLKWGLHTKELIDLSEYIHVITILACLTVSLTQLNNNALLA